MTCNLYIYLLLDQLPLKMDPGERNLKNTLDPSTRTVHVLNATMEMYTSSPFSAASLSTSQEIPTAEQQTRPQVQCEEKLSGDLEVQEMARQQWEELKPLIQKVYIDENKPFPYLAKILEKEGFKPT